MQITRVVLYHRDGLRSRDIDLRPGELNVITGVSETGKSMLIEIVDYCLGARRHAVYDDPSTRTLGWYGLELQIGQLSVAVARQAPEPGRKANARAHLAIGEALPSAPDLRQTTSVEALVKRLAALVGIEDTLQHSPVESGREPVRATFRNALAFAFQRQYEIANPKALFSGQGDFEVRNAIRDTLPYLLGAVDHDALETRRELARRRSELSNASAKLVNARRAVDGVRGRAGDLAREAAAVGLLSDDARDAQPSDPLSVLQVASEARPAPRGGPLDIELGAVGDRQDAAAAELRQVRAERRELVRRERDLDAFATEVAEQRSRLSLLALIPPAADASITRCPFCLAEHAEPDPHLREMAASLDELGGQLSGAGRDRPRLREAIDRLDAQEGELRRLLQDAEGELTELARRREAAAQLRTAAERQAFVRGRIVAFLENAPPVDGTDLERLQTDVDDLQVIVDRLSAELSADATRALTTTALNAVGRDMTALAQGLALQHGDGPGMRLDPVRLDVVAETVTGETRWLSEDIGAGKNWVGYHVVALLALHRFFAERDRPVPHLLMLDQVTQAFYPPERQRSADRGDADLSGADRTQVLRIFKALDDACRSLNGRLQIIVTDHADFQEPWFRQRVAHDWWTGEKLIPPDWASDG